MDWGLPEEYMKGERKRVAVYYRVGKCGPNETSLDIQKYYYIDLIKKHSNWELVAMYKDEGRSENAAFIAMMEAARAGKFDFIITKNVLRFCQPSNNYMEVIKELRQLLHPVGILFLNENLYTLAKDSDFILEMLTMVAENEMKNSYIIPHRHPAYLVHKSRRMKDN